jgi:hypothetical protein
MTLHVIDAQTIPFNVVVQVSKCKDRVLIAWLISHGKKYRLLICCERKTLLNGWLPV